MLNVDMLRSAYHFGECHLFSVVMGAVVLLNVNMLCVVMLSIIMLNPLC
jgi:hypothetical protein